MIRKPSSPQQIADDLRTLFGRPALFSGENESNYDMILLRFIEDFQPATFVEQTLLVKLTSATVNAHRLERQKSLLVERRIRADQAYVAKREADMDKARQDRTQRAAEEALNPPSAEFRHFDLQDAVTDVMRQVDTICETFPKEIDRANALEKGIKYYAELDGLSADAMEQINDTIDLIERLRDGLGSRLRHVAEDMIMAAAPPLSPATST